MIRKNKKADGKYLSVWWFFVILIIAVGIVVGTFLFFGKDLDNRVAEAEILNTKILRCLVEQGKVDALFVEGDFDIFEECELSREVLLGGDYFIKISLDHEDFKDLVFGANFEKDCNIQLKTGAEYFPRCIISELYVLHEGDKLNLRIIAGSNYYKK